MKFTGYDGEMELLDGAVKIVKGKKDAGRTIRLSDIVSVTLKQPTMWIAGCIHVQVLGARTYPSVCNATHYAADMNAICFRKNGYNDAVAFKDALEKALASSTGSRHEAGGVDDLRQLKQLLDDGVITQEDFDKKKAQILGL